MRDYSKLDRDELVALCKCLDFDNRKLEEALNKSDLANIKLNRTVLSYWRRIEALQSKLGMEKAG